MFVINEDLTIHITRGDAAQFHIKAMVDDAEYIFQPEDVVRFNVYAKKDCSNVVLTKDVAVTEETDAVLVELNKEDTKIGEVISKPTDYWYEVELNPENNPQTIIGYDENGAKIFKLFPEGGAINE